MNGEVKIPEQKESIKLIKGAKDYRWEIKLIGISYPHTVDDETVRRLERIDSELKKRFLKDEK